MLPPYPNNPHCHRHHYHCISHQESPSPNPTAAFLMPAASLDEYGQFFPIDMYNQETLEAVLRQPVTAPVPVEREPAGNGASVDGGRAGAVGAPRKRPFRTDRHSKIRTAQGVRDRRMRLSVGVARDFFALQDRLGFDRASKTVDWLLTQSKSAIDRLTDAAAPGATLPVTGAGLILKEKGEAVSSSRAGCFKDARERTTERTRGRGGDGSPTMLMEERGGGELDWIISEATAAATEQPMDGLEYYYQYYQLEEMMRAVYLTSKLLTQDSCRSTRPTCKQTYLYTCIKQNKSNSRTLFFKNQ